MQEVNSVVVVGGGPVGMTAALALARAGIPVLLLEAGDELSRESRASTFHPPTLEMLHRLGVADELVAAGLKAPFFQHRDRNEGLVAEFDLGVLAGDTRFPFRLQCEQSMLTPIILGRLQQMDHVTVRFGHRVTGVHHDGTGRVIVRAQTADGEEEFAAPWVIGADGAHSPVRTSLGLAFDGLTYPNRYLVVTTGLDLSEVVPGIAYVNYISDPSEWFVLLRTHREWRALYPVGLEEPDETLTNDDAVQRIMQGIAPRAQGYPIRHVTLYRVHQRVASSFRAGRVLLAGDAAHLNNPLGGMGMNSGIHDAYLLARSLARVWHQAADDSVLDEWAEDRRRTFVEHVQRTSDRNFSAIREHDSTARKESQDRLRAIAADPELARTYLLESSMLESVRAVLD